jgi:3-hydroxyacyl-[acyl-carrier-protein] dehydratase
MNQLRREIRDSLRDVSPQEGGGFRVRFVFSPEFVGFKGHFPGHPVLPGVCQVQSALVALEAWKKMSVTLREIVVAKFFAVAGANEDLDFLCREQEDRLIASIRSGEKKVAELTLRVSQKEPRS